MLNVVAIMGRLTDDPVLRHTPNQVPVCSFSVAVGRNYVKQGEERATDFINVVAWRSTAEYVSRYFKKGQLIVVNGSIQTRNYVDRNGNNRTAFEIMADNVHSCQSRNSSEGGYASYNPGNTFQPSNAVASVNQTMSFESGSIEDFEEIAGDSDLPF